MQKSDPAQTVTTDEADKVYLDERNEFNKAELDAIKQFDRYLITLSSGALGLSILFLEKVAPKPLPATYPWIIMAWGLFAGSLIAMLLSFLLSQFAWRRQRDILDYEETQRKGLDPPSHLRRLGSREGWQGNSFLIWINGLNIFSFLAFLLGVMAFLMFSYKNLPTKTKESPMTDQVTRAGAGDNSEERGSMPRNPPVRPAPPPAPKPQAETPKPQTQSK